MRKQGYIHMSSWCDFRTKSLILRKSAIFFNNFRKNHLFLGDFMRKVELYTHVKKIFVKKFFVNFSLQLKPSCNTCLSKHVSFFKPPTPQANVSYHNQAYVSKS
jgi:hypothetical protein